MRIRSLLTASAVCATALVTLLAPASSAQEGPPGRVLDRPLNGEAAVAALGDRLPDVARLNRMSRAELVAGLREDRTLWLDRTGRLHVKEERLPTTTTATAPEAAPFPTDATFRLHSKPGAKRTLHLDFDGHVVSGTAWNDSYALSSAAQPAFDLDGAPGTWSPAEHDVVQSVYQRVAEDFAPFDVDVTTQDPGADALQRNGPADELFGSHVLISPSAEALSKFCGGGCGGIAFVGVHDLEGSRYYQPAWVFPQTLGNDAKGIAEAASHEAGHNLGLVHDGSASSSYYTGHGTWAPIMGVGYYQPLVQWSSGEYPGADNAQDDLAVIEAYGMPLRADDHGSSVEQARPLGTATSASGVLERRTDRDVFAVERSCTGRWAVAVDPATVSPDLDVSARLLDGTGAVLDQDDPPVVRLGQDATGGLAASVEAETGPGTYYVEVDGVGAGDLTSGYSDYGSLGSYSLRVDGCSTGTAPGVPTSVGVAKDDAARTGTISWAPPASDGGSAVTGYRVSRDGTDAGGSGPWSTTVAATARSFTFTNLAAGSTYRLSVEAVNAVGTGPAGSGSITLGGGSTRTVTLNPVADTMARQQNPTATSGGHTTLLSDSEETTGNTTSRATPYLRFTVPTLAAGESISAASLSLQVSNGTANGPAIWRTTPSWDESTLSWNTGQPARSGTSTVGNFTAMAAGRVSTPISGITTAGEVSLQLHADASDGLAFATREATTTTDRPQLTLTITTG